MTARLPAPLEHLCAFAGRGAQQACLEEEEQHPRGRKHLACLERLVSDAGALGSVRGGEGEIGAPEPQLSEGREPRCIRICQELVRELEISAIERELREPDLAPSPNLEIAALDRGLMHSLEMVCGHIEIAARRVDEGDVEHALVPKAHGVQREEQLGGLGERLEGSLPLTGRGHHEPLAHQAPRQIRLGTLDEGWRAKGLVGEPIVEARIVRVQPPTFVLARGRVRRVNERESGEASREGGGEEGCVAREQRATKGTVE